MPRQKNWSTAAVISWHWRNMKQLEEWDIQKRSLRPVNIMPKGLDERTPRTMRQIWSRQQIGTTRLLSREMQRRRPTWAYAMKMALA